MKKNVLFTIEVTFCIAVIAVCGYFIHSIMNDYGVSDEAYQKASEKYTETITVNPVQDAEETEGDTESIQVRTVDFEGLQEVNPDIIAWIELPGTAIDYPVMQSSDNTDYLKTTYDGQYASAGSIFIDCNCDGLENQNTIIYGHNMKNGSMFHELKNLINDDFFAENNKFIIYTPENPTGITYKVISCYATTTSSTGYKLDFTNDEEWENWLQKINSNSLYEISYDIDKPVITLSTCIGVSGSGNRFIVHLQEI